MTKDELIGLKFLLGKMDGAAAIGVPHDIFLDNVTVEVKDAKFLVSKFENGRFDVNNDGWSSYFSDFAGVQGLLTVSDGELKAIMNQRRI
jgi:hypothetical protein